MAKDKLGRECHPRDLSRHQVKALIATILRTLKDKDLKVKDRIKLNEQATKLAEYLRDMDKPKAEPERPDGTGTIFGT